MHRAVTIRIAAAAAALGSLITPVVAVVRTATDPVDPVDVADTRARTGAQVTAETVRSNHVVVALVVLVGCLVLAAVFWWAAHRAARGGRIAPVVLAVTWVVGAVVWSGAAVDGAGGWALRGAVTVAGLIAVVAAMRTPNGRMPAPPQGTGIRSPRSDRQSATGITW